MTSTNFLFVIFFVLYATEQIYGSPPKQFGPRCSRYLPSPRPNRRGSDPKRHSNPLPTIGEDSDSFEIGNCRKPDDIFSHIPSFTRPPPNRIRELQQEDDQFNPNKRPPSPRLCRRSFPTPDPTDEETPEDNEIPGRHGSRHRHHPHHPHHHHHHHHHSHGHQHRHHPGCDCGCSQGPNLETNDIE